MWQVSPKLTCRWGCGGNISAPWHERDDSGRRVRSGERQDRLSQSCRRTCRRSSSRSSSRRTTAFRQASCKKDLNNWGPRVGVVYNLNEKTVRPQRLRRLLRQPQSERAAVHATGAAVLRAVLAAAGPHEQSAARRQSVPGSQQHPGIPGAVLDRSEQPNRLHRSSGTSTCSTASATTISSRWRTPAAGARTSTSATTSTRRGPARRRSRRACRIRRSSRRSSIRRMPATADFQRLSFRLEKRYSRRAVLPRQLPARQEPGQRVGRDRGERYCVCVGPRRGLRLFAVRPAPPQRVQRGLRAAVRRGQTMAVGRRCGGVHRSAAGGAGDRRRMASGFPFTVSSTNVCQCGNFVPQPRQSRQRRATTARSITRRPPGGSTRRRTRSRRRARRARRGAIRCVARAPSS